MNPVNLDPARGIVEAVRNARGSLTGELKDAQEAWSGALQSRDPGQRTIFRMERRKLRIEAAAKALAEHIHTYGENI